MERLREQQAVFVDNMQHVRTCCSINIEMSMKLLDPQLVQSINIYMIEDSA